MGLPEGKISMILGPSGTGKSVCIKHMVGLLYPDEGDVLVHGESVPNMADDELFEMRKKFGVLFQDGALFGSMNLVDNVAFPLRQHTDKSEDEILEIVNRRLREVGLADADDKMPNELSGGMRKRAGFARALVLDPDIVLFDEPDSGLDPVRTALLCELIQEIHEENGGAYVVITHDIMTRAPRGRVHRACCGRAASWSPARRGAVQLRQPLRPPVPVRRVPGPAGHGVAPAARARARCSATVTTSSRTRPQSPSTPSDPSSVHAPSGPHARRRLRRMTLARGAALAALVVAVVIVASAALRRRRARVQAACSRTPASWSRATTCRSAAAASARVESI